MGTPGKGGRPRKPSNLRVLEGDKANRFNDAEPQPGMAGVAAPTWLERLERPEDDEGELPIDVWRRLAPDLVAKGVLTSWDVDQFAVFCDAVVGHRRAAEAISQDGVTAKGMHGSMVKHPAAQLVRDYADLMTKVGARFGLTPSDRAGLKVEKESTGVGAERLLS